MSKPTVDYPRNGSYPVQYRRRRKKGSMCCGDCDTNYAKSLQGICKVIALILGALTFIIIGASPYFRTIFVMGGVTWPFHVVMLFTIAVWMATAFMYGLFMSGHHLSYPHVAWPKMEFLFNLGMAAVILFAAILEAANVWRWDMTQGIVGGMAGGFGGTGGLNSQLSGYGYQQGMSMTQSINFNSYCVRYPRDCTDYFGLLTGHNSYLGNHIFATVLLFMLLICYLVSTYFAFRTWRVFVRDMVREGELPKPTSWDRFKFRISEIKMPKSSQITERVSKLFNRNEATEDNNDGNNIEFDEYPVSEKTFDAPMSDRSSVVKKSEYASSSRSSGHKSRSSHHGGSSSERRSRSSSNPRSHKDGRSSRTGGSSHHGSSSDRRSERHSDERSHRSGSESRSGKRRSERNKKHSDIAEEGSLMVEIPTDDKKDPLPPVASLMV
ncbi:uncharacterized protein LOC100180658 [Ciona intestinalis]